MNDYRSAVGAAFRARRVAGLVALVFAAAVLGGCSSEPEEVLVGQWAGDSSAAGNAIRAAQLKSQSPDASTSTVMAAARAMGAIGLEFRADKTFTLMWQGKTRTGTWSYDAARKDVQLEFTPEPTTNPAGAAAGEAPDPAKWTSWVAELDADKRRMELFMLDRNSIDTVKTINPDVRGMVLKK